MRKKLVNPGVKYPKSKLVREALIKKRKREHLYTTCACGKVDYKTLVYLAKNSIKVIDNLAKTLASMEEKFDDAKDTVEFVTESANKQLKMKTDQLNLKDDQISFLRSTLIREGVKIDETQQ